MKLKRFLCLVLALCMVLSLSLPAFAVEGEETGSEPSETPVEVTEGEEVTESSDEPTEPSETPTEPSDEPTEGSEGEEVTEPSETPTEPETEVTVPEVTEPVVTPATPSLDGATVNVSDESIQAIADAIVSDDGYTYSFMNKNGVAVELTFSEYLNSLYLENPYILISNTAGSSYYIIYFSSAELHYSGKLYAEDNSTFYYLNKSSSELKNITSAASHTSQSQGTGVFNNIAYCNYDFYMSGSLKYASDAPQNYTVSFNTGFSDLVIDSQGTLGFVAPVPVYSGYRFDGWYFDEEYTLPFVNGYDFSADTTLYAKWTKYVTVSFVSGIEDYIPDSVQVLSGEAYTPPDFSYAGYEFLGVYADEDFKTPFVAGSVVDDDITLYLRFEPIVYDYGSMMLEISNRLEGLTYVVLAQSIITSVGVLALFFFRRDSMGV